MGVPEIRARLAVIQAGISGVRRAYANGPSSLPPGDLPLFVNFTGPATDDWRSLGSDYDVESRLYIMRLYVRAKGTGIDGEAEHACEPFFGSVRDTFAARPMLGLGVLGSGLAGVDAVFLGDQGVSVLPYAGEEFIGIEFRLQVVETIHRRFAVGE